MQNPILSFRPDHSQLRRLITLRSVAIAAQLTTLAAVWKFLELELNWPAMLLTITGLAAVNILSWLRLKNDRPVSNPEFFIQLCADVLALSILLYYGGGSTNPFISLYMLPLVIAAATLPWRYTWGMALITVVCYSLLMFYYVPLPQYHQHVDAFNAHVLGMWLGFAISAVVVAYFVVQITQAVRSRDELLVRAREDILRNEHIVALGTQAASAAHELGTPLSTMAVVIGELESDRSANPIWTEGLTILTEQVHNCKRILDRMLSNVDHDSSDSLQDAEGIVREVLEEWRLVRPAAQFNYHPLGARSATYIKADGTLRAALMNLLNNAADASPQAIDIRSRCDAKSFVLEIRDYGDGLTDEVLVNAGTAFFTTKDDGRGLGFFLANATIDRIGGTVTLFNHEGGGATTLLTLPSAGGRT